MNTDPLIHTRIEVDCYYGMELTTVESGSIISYVPAIKRDINEYYTYTFDIEIRRNTILSFELYTGEGGQPREIGKNSFRAEIITPENRTITSRKGLPAHLSRSRGWHIWVESDDDKPEWIDINRSPMKDVFYDGTKKYEISVFDWSI